MQVPQVPLGPFTISRVIQGCRGLAGDGVADGARSLLDAHLLLGVDTFDTADTWEPCEDAVGSYLENLRGGIHDHCKVFAKYSPEPKYTIPKAEVKAAIKESARRLGKSRHDCILLEWSDFQVNGWVEVAQHMAALKSEGLARAVGVVNFGLEQVRELVRRSLPVPLRAPPAGSRRRRTLRHTVGRTGSRGGTRRDGTPSRQCAPPPERALLARQLCSRSRVAHSPHPTRSPHPSHSPRWPRSPARRGGSQRSLLHCDARAAAAPAC